MKPPQRTVFEATDPLDSEWELLRLDVETEPGDPVRSDVDIAAQADIERPLWRGGGDLLNDVQLWDPVKVAEGAAEQGLLEVTSGLVRAVEDNSVGWHADAPRELVLHPRDNLRVSPHCEHTLAQPR